MTGSDLRMYLHVTDDQITVTIRRGDLACLDAAIKILAMHRDDIPVAAAQPESAAIHSSPAGEKP